ncbi:MAG: YfhO family protein [FCB group bacterium]|nr:YfhO family protein [FCB group bacterium]
MHNWIVQPDDSILNQTILSSSFNPQQYVGLAEDPGIEQAADSLAGINDMVTIETYANNFVALKTKSDADGMLVLGDNWYPAWKAFIDGTESKVYLANGSFRGVVLPAGEHSVEFRYISSTQRTGRYLTLVSFLFVLGVVVFDRLGARRRVQTGTVD